MRVVRPWWRLCSEDFTYNLHACPSRVRPTIYIYRPRTGYTFSEALPISRSASENVCTQFSQGVPRACDSWPPVFRIAHIALVLRLWY